MLHQTKGIVLRQIKYAETSVIVTVYTSYAGRQAYMVGGVRKAKAKHKAVIFQPLSMLDMVVFAKPKKELHSIREVTIDKALPQLASDFRKTSLAFFISEVLYKTLYEEEANEALFEFLQESIVHLDSLQRGFTSFHLLFMLYYSRFLGFFPNSNYSETDCFFDLKDGLFSATIPTHGLYLPANESAWLNELFNCTYETIEQLSLPPAISRSLLSNLIKYYQIHIDGFGLLKSYDVLQSIFR